jgi:1,4-alpha-glucan branching enzyme
MHDTLDYLAADPTERPGLHHHLTFPIWYAFDERYLLPLSHDEVVHLKKALLTKMPGDDWQRFATLRALFGYMYTHPGKKLLFMGGEIGQWAEWSEARSLDWHLLERGGTGGSQAPLHRGLQRCLADLNRLYASEPALYALDSHPEGFDWLAPGGPGRSVIAYLRRGREPGQLIAAVCNFSAHAQAGLAVPVPVPGAWHEVLSTDAAQYGGRGALNAGGLWAEPRADLPRRSAGAVRLGYALRLTLPPLGATLLRPGAPSTRPFSTK